MLEDIWCRQHHEHGAAVLGGLFGTGGTTFLWDHHCWGIFGQCVFSRFIIRPEGTAKSLISRDTDPADYDFHDTRNMASLDDDLHLDQHVEEGSDSGHDIPKVTDREKDASSDKDTKEPEAEVRAVDERNINVHDKNEYGGEVTRAELKSAFKRAAIYSTVLTAIVTIIGTF